MGCLNRGFTVEKALDSAIKKAIDQMPDKERKLALSYLNKRYREYVEQNMLLEEILMRIFSEGILVGQRWMEENEGR